MEIMVKISKAASQLEAAFTVRYAVFVKEQGFVDKPDDIDKTAYHAVAYDGDKAIGCGRFFGEGEVYHVGRIAVLPEYRGKGVGTLIMQEIENFSKGIGVRKLELSAQRRAKSFYDKLCYSAVSDEYLEEGYPHTAMAKNI